MSTKRRKEKPSTIEDSIYAKNDPYFPEIDLSILKNKLRILVYLANSDPANRRSRQRREIIHRTTIPQTTLKPLLEKLENEHFIEVVSREPYRKRGNKLTFQITTKGLVPSILYESSPLSQPLWEETPRWEMAPPTAYDPKYTLFEIESHKIKLPTYDLTRQPIDIPGFPYKHYTNRIPTIIKNNKPLFLLDYERLSIIQQDIAVKSAIVSAYKTGKQVLLNSPVSSNAIPEGLVKAAHSFPYLAEHFKNFEKEQYSVSPMQAIKPDELFIASFLSEPIIKKWDNWKQWYNLVTENADFKERTITHLTGEKKKLTIENEDVALKIGLIEEALDLLK